jgi:predicted AAA+ superfamily ATPase
MATSIKDYINKALEIFNQGFAPYVESELKTHLGPGWEHILRQHFATDKMFAAALKATPIHWDTSLIFSVVQSFWGEVFSKTLGPGERSLMFEIKDVRNDWAHQKNITFDNAYRALDNMERLLAAVSSPAAEDFNKRKQAVMRQRYEAQSRQEARKAAETPLEARVNGGLKPWREVITPHPDVSSGRYQQAEFAADLNQVYRREGSDEYRDPQEFFRRTYLTEGLKTLLTNALRRLSGAGGDPVIQLQTNFGGGKTHSMIALYHLFTSGANLSLNGVDALLPLAGAEQVPTANCAVLVSQAISTAITRPKPDGIVVKTMWGEMAYQLGGREAYALVAEADAHGVSPGSDALRELFTKFGPCLILIDEWVVFVRQLYGKDENPPPAGSFDANLSFAQALTEAARATPNTLIVASLPASDIEVGGEGGKQALARLEHTFGRLQSPWRPANEEEGFEIVRRRLFQDLAEDKDYVARDAVIRAFMEMYRSQSSEFPSECREAAYEQLLKNAYPIHPELFKRLYGDWGALDKFQRTRGVLRLMAAVIHNLWERQDATLLIMPASIPLDAANVKSELTQYLPQADAWTPIIERDVDGPNSLPLELDRANPTFGRYSASRRVARTLFVGSAPTLNSAHRGIEDNRIKLGCAQPKETVSTFGDALRRLSDRATHLYLDGTRYWFSTQPSVTRLAQDRAEQQNPDDVREEIIRRVKAAASSRGDFAKVHPCPSDSGDVPDERDARLVILPPEFVHNARHQTSDAILKGKEMLNQRGNSVRQYRNTLVFLAPDKARLAELENAVRQHLAWQSIVEDEKSLNLDHFQATQARKKEREANETIERQLPGTYCWLLTPQQEASQKQDEIEWQETRLQGDDPLAVRASKRLRNEEALIINLHPTILRAQMMDAFSLWRDANHISVKRLADDFAQYLFLYRLKDTEVLLNALKDGVASQGWATETFAFAESFDEETKIYRGLKAGESIGPESFTNIALIVRPDVALSQIQAQIAKYQKPEAVTSADTNSGRATLFPLKAEEASVISTANLVVPPDPQGQRFHGTVELNATRLGRDAGEIAENVVQHLAGIVGAKVRITLEIQADIPEEISDQVHRTVTENCRTLKFSDFGFEAE